MATVLCVIHIPYEKTSQINVEILRKKRDTENITSASSSFKDGDEETSSIKDSIKEDVVKEEEEEDSKSSQDVDENKSIEPPAAEKDVEGEDTNGFFKDAIPVIEQEKKSPKAVKIKTKDSMRSLKMYNRYISYDLTEGFYRLLQDNNIKRASWEFTEDGEYWQVIFPIQSKCCDKLLNELLNLGVGNNNYSSISILPVTVNFPSMLETVDKDEMSKSAAEKKQFIESIKSRLTVAQVIDSVRQGSQLTFDYLMLITMASVIAGVGLVENSSVLLVASMLVSPLMGPILGGTFGIVLQYTSLWKTGVRNEVIGLVICVVMGFVVGLLCAGIPGVDKVTSEMSSRGVLRSWLIGFIVAVPSGAGVALSILGGNAGSLVGVAISASLLPPAVNAGIFYAFALISGVTPKDNSTIANTTTMVANKINLNDYQPLELASMGTISLLLTFLNIIVIFLMGVVILKVKEVAPNTGTAVTRSFWKKDLKETRHFLKNHIMGFNSKLSETVIDEWGAMNNVDFSNKDTIKGEQGARIARELKTALEQFDLDIEFNGVTSRLPRKSGTQVLKRLASTLEPEEGNSRFALKKVFNVTDTTFHDNSRFMINKLGEADQASVNSTFDLNISGTETVKTKLPLRKHSGTQPLLKDADDDAHTTV